MPPSRMVRVVSAKESAGRDQRAIDAGTPSRTLMQRAGKAAAAQIIQRYPNEVKDGVSVFTGPGNNGGDGWVVAGELARKGIPVQVVEIAEPKTADAGREREIAKRSVNTARDSGRSGVVVDALLGTGAQGEPRGQIAGAIARINSARSVGARVAALDIPSGLDASTGAHSLCVVADMTLTFGSLKRGALLARDCCGEILVLDIGLEDAPATAGARSSQPNGNVPVLVDRPWVAARVPPITFDAHKGSRKHLAVVGGGGGMPGAVVLAARAALRSGIGILRAVVAEENVEPVLAAAPSALIVKWPANDAEISSMISEWAHAVVIGPGLGRSKEAEKLVTRLLQKSRQPVLLDADALTLFEGNVSELRALIAGRPALITPHPGEFARLAGVDVGRVAAERFDIGIDLARELGTTVLLKGTPSVVFSSGGERFVVPRGTAALATGGSGDMLAGIAGTLLAQTGDTVTAACCAAWVHGRAAELCGYIRGTTLDDVLYALPRAWLEDEPPLLPDVLAALPAVAR
ncbi:MAG: NAD(P)H-hydrate dehydratase [Gemmatimonadaceae bacterium]